MSSDLRDLYQEVILDHGRKPRNFRAAEDASHEADGYNPLCGDALHLYLKIEDGVVEDASFQGQGCAISTASASIMTGAIKGRDVGSVGELIDTFQAMLTGGDDAAPPPKLGKLAVFSGVREFPVRVKCATLAWHTLRAALDAETKPATTE